MTLQKGISVANNRTSEREEKTKDTECRPLNNGVGFPRRKQIGLENNKNEEGGEGEEWKETHHQMWTKQRQSRLAGGCGQATKRPSHRPGSMSE